MLFTGNIIYASLGIQLHCRANVEENHELKTDASRTGSAGVLAGEARRANVSIDSTYGTRAALVTTARESATVIHGLRFRALRSSPTRTSALPVLVEFWLSSVFSIVVALFMLYCVTSSGLQA